MYFSRIFSRLLWKTVIGCFYTILIVLFLCLCVEKKYIYFPNIYNLFQIYIFYTLFLHFHFVFHSNVSKEIVKIKKSENVRFSRDLNCMIFKMHMCFVKIFHSSKASPYFLHPFLINTSNIFARFKRWVLAKSYKLLYHYTFTFNNLPK